MRTATIRPPRDEFSVGPETPIAGSVYTPPLLAKWVSSLLLRSLPHGATAVGDFACGDGALLAALAEQAPALDLFGTDIDARAMRKAKRALPQARFAKLDALATPPGSSEPFWRRLGQRGFDGIILNPPWGIELEQSRSQLQDAGFELARGQYDSADLFVELAVKLLDEGGAAALILPDSLFFPDRAGLRKFLLDTCSIDLVARLGEGFFPGVYRGSAVVVLRRGTVAKGHNVECLRVSPTQRRLILAGEETLEQVAANGAHRVPQTRFATSSGAAFEIDVRETDLRHVRVIGRQEPSWTRTLSGGRGVELSKHGEVIECAKCRRVRPRPRKSSSFLCECGHEQDPARAAGRRIVRPIQEKREPGWQALVCGEDVTRHRCQPSREIQTGIPGIRYKAKIDLSRPRLLVRKTGIGIKAAIFDGDALTTQTVFHYQATAATPDFLLPYALGMLSSRVMLAAHLKRTGESEWRSHPYVTQKVLAELPIPEPEPNSQQWRQARAIASLVSSASNTEPGAAWDVELECLVAGFYDLKQADTAWVKRVLNEAQGLEGVASLRLPEDQRLAPVLVD